MNKIFTKLIMIGALVVSSSAYAQESNKDIQISNDAKSFLKNNSELAKRPVDVHVSDGNIHVSGMAANQKEINKINNGFKKIQGVKTVDTTHLEIMEAEEVR